MNFYGPQKHVPSKKSCERQKFANGLSLLKNCLELVKQTTLNVFILYIGRIGNFKKCMHRCCPNIQFCALSTCVKLCRGSKSKTAIGPDGKHKHFIVLRIFSNLNTHKFIPEILDVHFLFAAKNPTCNSKGQLCGITLLGGCCPGLKCTGWSGVCVEKGNIPSVFLTRTIAFFNYG